MKGLIHSMVHSERTPEWITSAVIAGFAITLMLPGDTLAGQGYRTFREAGLTEVAISVPLAVLASTSIIWLVINGNWRRTPILRAVCATFRAAIFGMLSAAFAGPVILYGFGDLGMSTGVGAYFVLMCADLFSAYRSGADVRVARSVLYEH